VPNTSQVDLTVQGHGTYIGSVLQRTPWLIWRALARVLWMRSFEPGSRGSRVELTYSIMYQPFLRWTGAAQELPHTPKDPRTIHQALLLKDSSPPNEATLKPKPGTFKGTELNHTQTKGGIISPLCPCPFLGGLSNYSRKYYILSFLLLLIMTCSGLKQTNEKFTKSKLLCQSLLQPHCRVHVTFLKENIFQEAVCYAFLYKKLVINELLLVT
jgi:hypothetical protein